jgi:hypothetical protein
MVPSNPVEVVPLRLSGRANLPGAKLAPSFKYVTWLLPPQAIIAEPVHTAVWLVRGAGAPVAGKATQVSLAGS